MCIKVLRLCILLYVPQFLKTKERTPFLPYSPGVEQDKSVDFPQRVQDLKFVSREPVQQPGGLSVSSWSITEVQVSQGLLAFIRGLQGSPFV